MQKLKKYLRLLLFLMLGITVVVASALTFFLYSNDAPVVTGNVVRNIEYKPGLKLDLYNPTRLVYKKTPVVIYIHGGAWIGGLKESVNFNRFNQAVNTLRDSGYAVVSINYTLARQGKGAFPACIDDAADAIKWLTENADQYQLDVDNFGLFGESAGAHIAMMLAYAQPSKKFTYVVDVYGPNQLAGVLHSPIIDSLKFLVAKFPERYQAEMNAEKVIFALDPETNAAEIAQMIKVYSPYNYVNASVPPTFIVHGNVDQVVPISQSVNLKRKLDSLGVENDLHIVTGSDHNFIHATPEQKVEFQNRVVDFIVMHYNTAR